MLGPVGKPKYDPERGRIRLSRGKICAASGVIAFLSNAGSACAGVRSTGRVEPHDGLVASTAEVEQSALHVGLLTLTVPPAGVA